MLHGEHTCRWQASDGKKTEDWCIEWTGWGQSPKDWILVAPFKDGADLHACSISF